MYYYHAWKPKWVFSQHNQRRNTLIPNGQTIKALITDKNEKPNTNSSHLCATSFRTVYRIFLSKHLSFRFSRNLTKDAILRERFERFGVSPTPYT